MKLLSFVLVFLVMTLEVRVKASVGDSPESNYAEIFHGDKSFINGNQLLSGSHWIRETKNYILQTPYGDIHSSRGDFFVDFRDKKVTVVNHLGDLKIMLRDGRKIELPPGFEVWVGELGADKKNLMGSIYPVDLRDHVINLGQLWTQDPKSLKEVLLKFESRWGDRTALAASYYKSLAQRKIASVQKEQDRIQSLKRQEMNRRAANRKLLFERAFGR